MMKGLLHILVVLLLYTLGFCHAGRENSHKIGYHMQVNNASLMRLPATAHMLNLKKNEGRHNWRRFRVQISDENLLNKWYCNQHDVGSDNEESNNVLNHEGVRVPCIACSGAAAGQSVAFTKEKQEKLINNIIPALRNIFATKGPSILRARKSLNITKDVWAKSYKMCHNFRRPEAHEIMPVQSADAVIYIAATPFKDTKTLWGKKCTHFNGRVTSIALAVNPCYLNAAESALTKRLVHFISTLLWTRECPDGSAFVLQGKYGTKKVFVCVSLACTPQKTLAVRFKNKAKWVACTEGSYVTSGKLSVLCPKSDTICGAAQTGTTNTLPSPLSDNAQDVPKRRSPLPGKDKDDKDDKDDDDDDEDDDDDDEYDEDEDDDDDDDYDGEDEDEEEEDDDDEEDDEEKEGNTKGVSEDTTLKNAEEEKEGNMKGLFKNTSLTDEEQIVRGICPMILVMLITALIIS